MRSKLTLIVPYRVYGQSCIKATQHLSLAA